ncbi:MAG TPA: energy-coupling factor transporter transmembrane protein EcfT [Acidimicrobiales bacterium]|jgi:energy-coupling factor transporter transmembrane protein EcfT|nr:energy-coupling factor transporter transmembrane protein EcfT [Acidimicrobiales bacterium]
MTDRAPVASGARAEEPYRPPQLNLLREVKVDSPIHRLWAGTKLLVVAGVSITLSYFPTWGSIGLITALLLTVTLLGRIPSGAWPRPPRWFWIAILVTGTLASAAAGSPHLVVGGVRLGFGGLDAYCKFMCVGILLLAAAAVLGWTTPLGEIAPAVAKLLWPLRWIRVPVDELAVTVALSVRSLPLLVNEVRTLIAARRLRPMPERPGRSEIEKWLEEIVDIMVAAMAVSVRRAGELAEAITARGGTGMIAARAGNPGRADVVALVLVAAICLAASTFP